ncbi:MAG TPA: hypothetical protein VD993_12300 [Chitinophagaceae bacterium]|nr:hypothetical protein [Chitinophagaceae bacterium]
MEREKSQFSRELLQMMRDEEREKFLSALKNGASWGQLFQIRSNIRKLNDMIEAAEHPENSEDNPGKDEGGRNSNESPRYSPNG